MKETPRRPRIRLGWIVSPLRRRNGTAAVMIALLAVPLGAAVGIAIDVGRLEFALHSVQGTIDAAAMAGATVFTDISKDQAALVAANNYLAKGMAGFPSFVSLTPPTVAVAPATSCDVANAANTVSISTTVSIKTTLLWLFVSQLQSKVVATGAMPIVQMTLVLSGNDFASSTADLDSMYWYTVPSDGGAPDISNLHLILSNASSTSGDTVTQCISPLQQIGFAFSDEPGAHLFNYGPNMYGGAYPNIYYYYSTLFPPAILAYPDFPYDAALQIVAVNPDGTYPDPSIGFYLDYDQLGYGDFLPTAEPLAPVASSGSVSCATLNGGKIHIYWNDMGVGVDNLNYTDGEITFGCSEGQALLPYLMR